MFTAADLCLMYSLLLLMERLTLLGTSWRRSDFPRVVILYRLPLPFYLRTYDTLTSIADMRANGSGILYIE